VLFRSVEYYGTIFAAAESPLEPGLLWTGSDDGLIHISRDAGKTWKNVTPKGMPEWIMINAIDPSPFDKGGAYVAATMYKSDDFRPYLYKTSDYGATWTKIDTGIPASHFTRVVRADPKRRGLLYAGTESGLYVSFDDGARWQTLQLNLPLVPITDLTIKEDDLIAATQGRSFWILDDLTPLREIAAEREIADAAVHFYPVRPAYRLRGAGGFEGGPFRAAAGQNPFFGPVFHYYVKDQPKPEEVKKARLEILTPGGEVIRTFKAEEPKPKKDPRVVKAGESAAPPEEEKAAKPEGAAADKPDLKKDQGGEAAADAKVEAAKKEEEEKEDDEESDGEEIRISVEPGLHRFAWDMTWRPSKGFPGMILWGGGGGGIVPVAVPGRYQARLTIGDQVLTQEFELLKDPRTTTTQEDLTAQFDFLKACRDKVTAAHDAIRRIRELRGQLDDLKARHKKEEAARPVLEEAKKLDEKMKGVEEALYQTKNRSSQDPLNFPIRLTDKLSGLAGSAALGDYRPTAQAVEVQRELFAAIDAELAKLQEVWEKDLPALDALAREKGVSPIVLPPARLK
jgi:hypothetical protein